MLLPRRIGGHGGVDGVWWPRSRNLNAEFPNAIPAVGVRLDELRLLQASTSDWDPIGRQIRTADGPVATMLGNTPGFITLIGTNATITFGLIRPDSPDDEALIRTGFLLNT
ncbi:DUF5994 family protein [Tsukamurella sp. 1534]|uniref:DUF5994 family protein n=1 Tax=Tsukamurella sp. 1534 TaxID=1151061 RepID=UPI0002E76DF2|nr:DUF5994 family protein [Tsukamurella sp. 1534]